MYIFPIPIYFYKALLQEDIFVRMAYAEMCRYTRIANAMFGQGLGMIGHGFPWCPGTTLLAAFLALGSAYIMLIDRPICYILIVYYINIQSLHPMQRLLDNQCLIFKFLYSRYLDIVNACILDQSWIWFKKKTFGNPREENYS